jgi:adenylyltransferase/sulfurtransferase
MVMPAYVEEGQLLLKAAQVLVIGAGGLGCPILTYLAAAGIGYLGIVDDDVVEESNLHRQVLFSSKDVGQMKAKVAARKIKAQNPFIQVNIHTVRITALNAKEIISEYDLVIDGSDNFPTRYLINDACVLLKKPLVYGAIHQHEGQVSVFNYEQKDGSRGPNYRDLFPEPPPRNQIPNCAEAGVLGVLPGIIGCLQANEAIKIVLKQEGVLSGTLLLFDAMAASVVKVNIAKNANNPLYNESIELIDYEAFCGLTPVPAISLDQLRQLHVNKTIFDLIDVREVLEFRELPSDGKNIPLSELSTRAAEISTKKQVVFMCLSGTRSVEAIRMLYDLDMEGEWSSLEGGLRTWLGE